MSARFGGKRDMPTEGRVSKTGPLEEGGVQSTFGRPRPTLGLMEWFRMGERERVEKVLADTRALGVSHLRTVVSWADWVSPGGEEWYSWLLPRLGGAVDLLPCFVYTPPSLGVEPRTSAPPRDPKWYADFIDQMITLFGDHFEWVELWNEPNNVRYWDVSLDPEWKIFSKMINGAAYWAHQRGKKTLLGGTGPVDSNFVALMCEREMMNHIDAVGIHGYPVTFDWYWPGWTQNVARVREALDRYGKRAEIWITETGYSTLRHDERRQVAAFLDALEAPVERIYWYGAQDLERPAESQESFHADERDYHFGLKRADDSEKLLYRLWAKGGVEAVHRSAWLTTPIRCEHKERPALITGGAGFIGTNLAHRLLSEGRPVLVYDNLSRPGVERNLQWLHETHGSLAQIEFADVRDPHALNSAVRRASQVFHFAAQVAVTTSLVNPVHDFEVNGRGTLNLLEAMRDMHDPPPLVFTSTNKVYGGLEDMTLILEGHRYAPKDPVTKALGVSEARPLDFHSPYGCSKGLADQYILDYARTFGIPAVVFRMSCIYGPHQYGTEDQGWVAHFLIQALEGKPITLYGDGKQVRDVLFVEDLVNAFLLAQENMETLTGQAFNIGGGPDRTISLLELLDLIAQLTGKRPAVRFDAWRPGDQRYYVSDTTRFQTATGWQIETGVQDGVTKLYQWLVDSRRASTTRAGSTVRERALERAA